ncbi:MAG: hypothetical protein VX382_01055 [Candidatus Thermoplasmatota archaeon]|jgi:hypothetical protein|nr:hypothetical protein [Candidatus Thermoplasmatota archaeon]MEC7351287.1 hypothetical protein [Candidatus Thermoplasmatota archaeon]MEC7504816.1 hypothetical protein [Candidatus Thermoplasmatota archaeon]MEC7635430.1 hypothetical protein [Candidatus Thermoplasmatota archaeon]MEC8399216.1 hypothetical protein [Candidatus Thermoplasmatota archaeon]|tara:strand:+ start:483 stop:1397 length:915 start_codon:yes stop_codon:yes gene_type:complete
MTINRPSADTSHLYDGKTVRSSAPSRKKAAGQVGTGSGIPEDAIPTVEIPGFIESLLGGPLVPKMKFLPPDKMVQNLQIGVYGVLVGLAFLTYIISPPQGTMWYILTGSLGLANIMQLTIIASATVLGFMGTFKRDARLSLGSNLLFILAILRFASSKTSLALDVDIGPTMLSVLVVVYAVLLIMYFELSNGVIRYSMLDTSIRTNEVYVMNPKKIVGKYHRSLVINPILATLLAWFVLSANTILPAIVGIFSSDTAQRMRESVELTSVYGVALGTLFVFITVGILFGLNLPTHLQRFRERQAE